jgi:hypothetical protein
MATVDIKGFLNVMPTVKASPGNLLWLSYDAEADVLYVNFRHWTGIKLRDAFDKPWAVSQRVMESLIGHTQLRHIQSQVLFAVKERGDLIGRPNHRDTIRRAVKSCPIAQCIPSSLRKIRVGPIKENEREFHVQQRPARVGEIGLQQVTIG